MGKNNYEVPEAEVIELDLKDIIFTSGEYENTTENDDIIGPEL